MSRHFSILSTWIDLFGNVFWGGKKRITRVCYCLQAETRAEFAERTVAKLEKSIDDLEGKG